MQSNRINYTYQDYQEVLLHRWDSTLLWLTDRNHDPNSYRDLFFCRPTPRTMWLPGKPRKKYFLSIRNRLQYQMRNNSKNYTFCTLTYSNKLYSREKACSLITLHLRRFIRRIRKRYGKQVQYFWVIELTKRGYPHIHIIFNQFLYWKVIRACWWAETRNHIIDIRKIPGSGAGKYITKYVTKTQKHNESQYSYIFKHINRIFGYSQKFFHKAEKKISNYITLAISFSLNYSDKYLFRPSPDTEFWPCNFDFIYPLLLYDIYIPRKLCKNIDSWNIRNEMLNYFNDNTIDYINLAESFYLGSTY